MSAAGLADHWFLPRGAAVRVQFIQQIGDQRKYETTRKYDGGLKIYEPLVGIYFQFRHLLD